MTSATVIDISGRVLQVIDLNGMNDEQEISLQRYSNGNYFIKIESLDSSIVKQIIKKKRNSFKDKSLKVELILRFFLFSEKNISSRRDYL